ncbi:hypothetical protein SAMN03159496_04031 [Rhizobium sp. NFR07]|uniref:NrsF family protein n=1 Tax=Rhizobium sp. NFR07 TaxID=1566262 RepID=UPI0008ECA5FD|nr:DUF1109 domain-containing protein [Rhizobium sp. NFR07]SFB46763.1 hypothetical protein SAMN03159496_04031 [Rhizobium sp. NFR07]
MKTDDLIDRLAGDLRPVPPGALGRLLALALLPGLVLSAALILLGHGPRPDLAAAIYTPAFWAKSIYPLALAVAGITALMVVARPGGLPHRSGMASVLIYLALVVLGLWQLRVAPVEDYPTLIFGISAWFCPFIIVAAALPVFAAIVFFLRRSAPTNLPLAGGIAGLAAGSVGAWTYSWGCIENGLTFVALWYTLGIVICGAAGAFLGRPLLRW